MIQYAPQAQAAADLLARHLAVRTEPVQNAALAPGQVVLFAGKDFTKVLANPRAARSGPANGLFGSTPGKRKTTTTTTTVPEGLVVPPTTAVIGQVPGDPPAGQSCS